MSVYWVGHYCAWPQRVFPAPETHHCLFPGAREGAAPLRFCRPGSCPSTHRWPLLLTCWPPAAPALRALCSALQISENRQALDKVTEVLLEKETLTGARCARWARCARCACGVCCACSVRAAAWHAHAVGFGGFYLAGCVCGCRLPAARSRGVPCSSCSQQVLYYHCPPHTEPQTDSILCPARCAPPLLPPAPQATSSARS